MGSSVIYVSSANGSYQGSWCVKDSSLQTTYVQGCVHITSYYQSDRANYVSVQPAYICTAVCKYDSASTSVRPGSENLEVNH